MKIRLLKFGSSWCGPCKLMAPIVKEFADKHKNIELNEIDVDQNPGLAQSYGISSIPSIVVINASDNTVVKVIRGLKSMSDLEKEVL